ncbi:hypothetical protein CK203_042051 [Vitis vinifera]|uniref:Reverse transcriptase Ty1/copia-type domain-containing protein n=1 Tax=Vitis vinifera TaxID=29760 RepID=A0A438HHB3_VITVI|nr:hypothetical protein CK203_042051 [Vitis vinifera]
MEEMRALEMNGTWDLISLPRGKTTIGCTWVFTVKYKPDGSMERYKVDGSQGLYTNLRDNKIVILIVYADDVILTGDNIMELEKLKGLLAKEFQIKDLGQLGYFLGMEVARF